MTLIIASINIRNQITLIMYQINIHNLFIECKSKVFDILTPFFCLLYFCLLYTYQKFILIQQQRIQAQIDTMQQQQLQQHQQSQSQQQLLPYFDLIQNTLNQSSSNLPTLKNLIKLKCLYSQQLTKMPRQYLIKLLFDTYHQSLIIKLDNQIIAGITYRSFDNLPFYQIAFVAVKQQFKHKGYGSLIMNKLKNITQQRQIEYIYTFADNNAIGFFQKHGFSKNISLRKQQYQPYIKEYIGGILMECKIDVENRIDFENINVSLQRSREEMIQRVKSLVGLAWYDIEKSANILEKVNQSNNNNGRKQLLLSQLVEYIPGYKQVTKTNISQSHSQQQSQDRRLSLNFLLYCQNYIQLATNKITPLKENIQQYQQRKNIIQEKQLKRRKQLLTKYKLVLHQMQIKLIQGDFKYKDQFINYVNDQLKQILGDQEKLKTKEKQFMNKIKQLNYQFMKNILKYQSNKDMEKKYHKNKI